MPSALQIAHTDLTGAQKVSATNAVQPAKRPRDYSKQTKAMKMAWASYRKWEADFAKEHGEPVGRFNRAQFNMYLRNSYQTMRIAAMGTVYITREEAQFIGSDCLMKMQEAA